MSHKVGEVGLSLAHGAVHPGSGLTRPRLCPLYYGKCALSLENTASFIKPSVFLFTEGGRLTSQQPVICDSVSRGRRVAGRGARLCTLLFRYATLPWMYLVSRIFSSSDVAFISYISLNFIFGLCTMLMTVMPRLLAIVSKAQVRDPLRGLPGVRGGRELPVYTNTHIFSPQQDFCISIYHLHPPLLGLPGAFQFTAPFKALPLGPRGSRWGARTVLAWDRLLGSQTPKASSLPSKPRAIVFQARGRGDLLFPSASTTG